MERIDNDRAAARLAGLDRAARRLDLNRISLWQHIQRWFDDLLDRIRPHNRGRMWAAQWARLSALQPVGGLSPSDACFWRFCSAIGCGAFSVAFSPTTARARRTGSREPATAAEARKQASTQAQSGDYRGAVRSLFLSALLHLRENDMLHYLDSHTDRGLLASLPTQSPAHLYLQPVVETFERVWYGIREPDEHTLLVSF